MITIQQNDSNDFIWVTLQDRVGNSDYQTCLPLIETSLREHPVRGLLLELKQFKGWEASEPWENLGFLKDNQGQLIRIAVLGERLMDRWFVQFLKTFLRSEVRYFNRTDLQSAIDWVRAA